MRTHLGANYVLGNNPFGDEILFGKIIRLKNHAQSIPITQLSDVSRISLIFTEFTCFPQGVSETHTSLHSTSSELQLILHYDWNLLVPQRYEKPGLTSIYVIANN